MKLHNLSSFKRLVDELKSTCISLWLTTGTDFPMFEKKIKLPDKVLNEWKIERFRKSLNKAVTLLPKEYGWNLLSQKILPLAEELEYQVLGDEYSMIEYFVKHGYSDITKAFIEEVRSFDSKIDVYDIFQAIRNVWIINSIQIIFNVQVRLTPSIFSYSMLYPYTDNFLDDSAVTTGEKKEFNDRLRKCLLGQQVEALNHHEERVFQLVHRIENEFCRQQYPEVFHSLIAIHHAQETSLAQQNSENNEIDLISISFEKGGTSVLADGYLVKGELASKEASFVFGYGVLLQLLDDLQDVSEDLKNGHMTVFSQAALNSYLDKLTNKLFWFIEAVLNNVDAFLSHDSIQLKKIIHFCCINIIVQAVAMNRKMFSKGYLKKVQDYSMVRLSYYSKLNKKLHKQYSQTDLNNIITALTHSS